MTIPVPIFTSLIAAGAAILIAFAGASFNIYSRLGRLERGQEALAAEILASRERSDMQHSAAMERLAAFEERALAREAASEDRALAREAASEDRALAREAAALARESAAEERALAQHNELLAEIRLWRTHGHDADGNIFFRVPE